MRNGDFWSGFAAGAGVAVGALLGLRYFTTRDLASQILRVERSVQVGAPVEQVFAEWSDFNRLRNHISAVKEVRTFGSRSHWVVEVDGKTFEWDAELSQNIPGQALGWKSLSGPQHTGRVTFAPVGKDTLILVTMNYHPPLGRLAKALGPVQDELEHQVEQALRDFKAALEGKGQSQFERATGTHGGSRTGEVGTPGAGARDNSMGLEPPTPVDSPSGAVDYTVEKPGTVSYTRPPKDSY